MLVEPVTAAVFIDRINGALLTAENLVHETSCSFKIMAIANASKCA